MYVSFVHTYNLHIVRYNVNTIDIYMYVPALPTYIYLFIAFAPKSIVMYLYLFIHMYVHMYGENPPFPSPKLVIQTKHYFV